MTARILIMAKAPLPGQAKTRLAPALGEQGAAALAEAMLRHTVREALAADIGPVELCVAPHRDLPVWTQLPETVELSEQGAGDLGERMGRAARRVLADGVPVLLIGTDCPALDAGQLRNAVAALREDDAVMIPATDGGYVLLGLKQFAPALFAGIPWSTERVAALTRARIAALGWTLAEPAPLPDIDEPDDLQHLPGTIFDRSGCDQLS